MSAAGMRKEILEKVKLVPAMPPAAVELVKLLQNPNVDMDKVVRLAEHDPGLTSNLLRSANSAFYTTAKGVHSVREAVSRLGLKWVYQTVVSSAVSPLAKQEVRGYDMAPGYLLSHSIMVASGTEEIAKTLKLDAPGHTFTAGLLHDLGKLVLGTYLKVDVKAIIKLVHEKQISFDDAEREVIGIDHAEVGAVLLETWHLPDPIVETVRWHHQPDALPKNSLACDLVHMADNISMLTGMGQGSDGLNYTPSPKVVARLHMKAALTELVVFQMINKVKEWQQLLGVK
jgi:putative nucleotidyltransferase with HDIG domain